MEAKNQLEETFKLHERSIVRLHPTGTFQGNGFFVYAKGRTRLIMTCYHILKGLPVNSNVTGYISISRSARINATLLLIDKTRDLALLRANNVPESCGIVEFTHEPTIPGQKLVLLCFFNNSDGDIVLRPGTFPGEIIAQPSVVTPEPLLFELIRGNYSSRDGSSGAPVFEVPNYNAVGVHVEGALGLKSAVSVQTILAALRAWCPEADQNATIKDLLEHIAKSS